MHIRLKKLATKLDVKIFLVEPLRKRKITPVEKYYDAREVSKSKRRSLRKREKKINGKV